MIAPRRTATILLALLLGCPGPQAASGEPLPYRLQVEVQYGEPQGPATLRQDLEYEAVAVLRAAGCFRVVQPRLEPPFESTDLRLLVTVGRFEENVTHELSIAQRASPSAGPTEQFRVARISAVFQADVETLAGAVPLRDKRFRLAYAWRPVLGEDPRQKVQLDLLAGAGRKLRSFVCKGSPRIWSKQLEAASSR